MPATFMVEGARKSGKEDNKREEWKDIEYHCGRQHCRDGENRSAFYNDYGHEFARAEECCDTSRKEG